MMMAGLPRVKSARSIHVNLCPPALEPKGPAAARAVAAASLALGTLIMAPRPGLINGMPLFGFKGKGLGG